METVEVTYPVIMADGHIATLKLPVKLSLDDAKRISELVFALAEGETSSNGIEIEGEG